MLCGFTHYAHKKALFSTVSPKIEPQSLSVTLEHWFDLSTCIIMKELSCHYEKMHQAELALYILILVQS